METNNASENGKRIWIRLLIGFFVAMALLTFFSSTINNISKPRVSVSPPSSAALQKVVVGSGSFAPKSSKTVDMDFTCKVNEVFAAAGEAVKAGDTLFTLDSKSLLEQLKTEQDALTKMKNNRKKMVGSYTPQDLTQLQIALEESQLRAEQAQKDVDYVQGNVSSGTGTQRELDAAKLALKFAQDDVVVKQKQLELAKQQNSKGSQASKLDLANADIDIAAQQKKVDALQAYADSGGKIISPIDGIVQQVNAQAGGTVSPASPAASVTDYSRGLEFTADVSIDDADIIPVGAQMDIQLKDGVHSLRAALLEKKDSAKQPGEMVTLVLHAGVQDIVNMNVQPGAAAEIRYAQLTKNYDQTVPNSAVRQDSTGYFVLVMQEKDTPLGKQAVLRRMDVSVVDSDEFRTAISGPVGPNDQVITGSDKPVADGDAVLVGP